MKNQVEMTCELVSVDLENYRGVFKFKKAHPKNAPWNTVNVSLSGLLRKLIEKEDHRGLMVGDTFVGTQFTCATNSPNYSDNPFKLIKFEPVKGSDIPVNYRLELVNQRRDNVMSVLEDIFDEKYEVWYNKKRKFRDTKFMRSLKVKTEGRLKDFKYPVVLPE